MTPPKKLGLSLSGGGYRASVFHLGTLKKLHELGILQKVDVLSTISGGSITGAYYSLHAKEDFSAIENFLYEAFQTKNVIRHVLFSFTFFKTVLFGLVFLVPAFYFLFTCRPWLFLLPLAMFFILLFRYQFHIFPASKEVERAYDKFFYEKKTLAELGDSPQLVVGSTNLQTGRPFSFSRNWMQDSTYQFLKDDNGQSMPVQFISTGFPISRAVMASSCVPFAFTPISIDKQYFLNPGRDYSRVNPQLVDGGVYDNQGIHKIMHTGEYSCAIIISSDAGNRLSPTVIFSNTISLLLRTVSVFMARIKNAQIVQDVYGNTATANKEIAYLSLGWDLEKCIPGFIDNLAYKHITAGVIQAQGLLPEWVAAPNQYAAVITSHLENKTGYAQILASKPDANELKAARNTATNLVPLSKLQTDGLIKQAACLTELQVKLYCPSLINPS